MKIKIAKHTLLILFLVLGYVLIVVPSLVLRAANVDQVIEILPEGYVPETQGYRSWGTITPTLSPDLEYTEEEVDAAVEGAVEDVIEDEIEDFIQDIIDGNGGDSVLEPEIRYPDGQTLEEEFEELIEGIKERIFDYTQSEVELPDEAEEQIQEIIKGIINDLEQGDIPICKKDMIENCVPFSIPEETIRQIREIVSPYISHRTFDLSDLFVKETEVEVTFLMTKEPLKDTLPFGVVTGVLIVSVVGNIVLLFAKKI